MNILDRIIETKKAEIARLPARFDGRGSTSARQRASFVEAIRCGRPALVAEVKPKSPSGGTLLSLDRVPALVAAYDRYATAISVLCDKTYFGGGYELLGQVASMTDRPLLAKEFVIDERQIALAASHGASAVLLIAAILDVSAITSLAQAAMDRGCDVLLEVHGDDEVDKAAGAVAAIGADAGRVVLGINHRNLDTLEIDLGHTERLSPIVREKLGSECLLLAESGVDSPAACRRLLPYVDGFLIGTSILRSPDPAAFLSSLVSSCSRE